MPPPDAPGTSAATTGPPTDPTSAAVLAAASGGQLDTTLRDIVEAAVRHVDATYGAMGVLTADGRSLDRFVIVGMDEADAERIGRMPSGHGILGLLVAEPATLRMDDLGGHPASTGFSEGNPPMESFLGVPVRVGESVFGNLYLTEKRSGGPFTAADEEIAQGLAGVAGLAITNARLAEWAETRRRWESAAAEMATALLSGAEPEQVLRSVCTRVSGLTGADMVGVLTPSTSDDGPTMTIVTAVGPGADEVEGVRVPLAGTDVGTTWEAGMPRLIQDISTMPVVGRRAATVVELTAGFGPGLLAPLGSAPDLSLLVALRYAGRELFDEDDLQLLSGFAAQASVALELARAQQRERALQVQADRDRIARDLHDHVVQRIFATALSLDRLGRSLEAEHGHIAARLSRSVDDLHATIVRIRTSIFELHQSEDTSPDAVRARLTDVVRSVTEGHDLQAGVQIRLDVDDLPADLLFDLVAVVRELVTNVVRHARARRMTVAVEIAHAVLVTVTDDGCGLPAGGARSGLANLTARAERRAGTLACRSSRAGTEIAWTVPLPS